MPRVCVFVETRCLASLFLFRHDALRLCFCRDAMSCVSVFVETRCLASLFLFRHDASRLCFCFDTMPCVSVFVSTRCLASLFLFRHDALRLCFCRDAMPRVSVFVETRCLASRCLASRCLAFLAIRDAKHRVSTGQYNNHIVFVDFAKPRISMPRVSGNKRREASRLYECKQYQTKV